MAAAVLGAATEMEAAVRGEVGAVDVGRAAGDRAAVATGPAAAVMGTVAAAAEAEAATAAAEVVMAMGWAGWALVRVEAEMAAATVMRAATPGPGILAPQAPTS